MSVAVSCPQSPLIRIDTEEIYDDNYHEIKLISNRICDDYKKDIYDHEIKIKK